MDKRKELKEIYKTTKPDMGIFIIQSNKKNKCHIKETGDLKGALNSVRFKLDFGNYANGELQEDWKKVGESGFTIEILEKLTYDTNESKTDYSEELNILRIIWEDRLTDRGLKFYKK